MSQESFNEWGEVAELYEKQEDGFSHVTKRNFRTIADRLDFDGGDLLDVACGDGEFAAFAANRGYTVTGVDKSDEMLRLTEERTAEEGVDVTLQRRDMRELTFTNEFDFATCWYNSVNYLCEPDGLRKATEAVYESLRQDGVFVFDFINVNRLMHFAESPAIVPHDTDELFEAHHDITYDAEDDVLSVNITGFVNEDGTWKRVDETHKNRGYRVEQVRNVLKEAGFEQVTFWGDVEAQTEPSPNSERIWTVAEK